MNLESRIEAYEMFVAYTGYIDEESKKAFHRLCPRRHDLIIALADVDIVKSLEAFEYAGYMLLCIACFVALADLEL